jgi:hypothetical protein
VPKAFFPHAAWWRSNDTLNPAPHVSFALAYRSVGMSLGLLCRAVFHNATARRCHVGMQSRNARRSLMATLSAMQHEQPQQHALRGNSERDVYVVLGLVDEPPSRNISPFYGQIPPALTPLQPGTRKTWHESIRLRYRSKNDTIARCFDIVCQRDPCFQ